MLLMSAGMLAFVVNDAIIKQVSATLPSGQLIVLRGLMASALLLLIWRVLPGAAGEQGSLRQLLEPRVLLRALFDAVATLLYLSALFKLPLANVTAINMMTPLVIALITWLVFGERLSAMRWLAIIIGLLGVLLIVQPRAEDWNAFSLLAVASTLFHALRDITTRHIRAGVPSLLLTLSTALAVLLLAGILSLIQGWRPVSTAALGQLAAAAVFLSLGYFWLISSMRVGEITAIAPFRYTGLLFALLLGYLIFGEVPNLLAWYGMGALLLAGLILLRRDP